MGALLLALLVSLATLLSAAPAPAATIGPGGEKWRYATMAEIKSSPALGKDGAIYVGSADGQLHAVNPDGTPRWAFNTGLPVPATPAIGEDGTVYVGNFNGQFYAVNPNGTQKWVYSVSGYYPFIDSSAAIAADGTIYVGSSDDKLHALNPDGTLKWAFSTFATVNSSPAVGKDGTVYVGCEASFFYAVNPNGTQKWVVQSPSGEDSFTSSPALAQDGTIYVGSYDGVLYALNPDGSQKWTYAVMGSLDASPVLAPDGTVYIGSTAGTLYAVNPDGTEKWNYPVGPHNSIRSSAAVGADGAVYVGVDDNFMLSSALMAFSPAGSLLWSAALGSYPYYLWGFSSSPVIGLDGTVYVGSADGNLYAILSEALGAARSPWPLFRQNPQRTGRAPAPPPRLVTLPFLRLLMVDTDIY